MGTRKSAKDLHTIGIMATNASHKHLPATDSGLLRMVQQGAAWDRTITAKTGYRENSACECCGDADADITHIIWHCRCFADE